MLSKDPALSQVDKDTLERLFAEHRTRLLAFVRYRLGRALAAKVDADEIVADAFIRAAARLHDVPAEGADKAYRWIERIADDCIKDAHRFYHTRIRDVRREQPLGEQAVSRLQALVSPITTPSSVAARREMEARLAVLFQQLGPNDRAILTLVEFQSKSFKEAGEALGIREGTARQHHFRAVIRFRRLWQQHYGPEGGTT
jgi:RNA polymerase sigma factor (sigma-70 family)